MPFKQPLKNPKHPLISILLFISIYPAHGQSKQGEMLWIHTYFQGKMSEKWALGADASWRFRDPCDYLNSFLMRAGFHYRPKDHAEFGGGYAAAWTYPPPASANSVIAEHRLWQQFVFEIPTGRWKLQYRLRPEQQWFDDPNNTFRLRMRNLLGLRIRLFHSNNWNWTAEVYDEFFPARDNLHNFIYTDQNRIYTAVQTEYNEKIALSAGYQHNYFPGRADKRPSMLHQLRIHLKYYMEWTTHRKENKPK